jgi:hypothetical protein
MKHIKRAALAIAAMSIAALSAWPLPATAAQAGQAAPGAACFKDFSVCAFTEPDFQGLRVHINNPRPYLEPPINSALNNSRITWCFYEYPGYDGPHFALESGQADDDFPYPVQSARPAGLDGC